MRLMLLISEVDPLGRELKYSYEGKAVKLKYIFYPDGTHYEAKCDELGLLQFEKDQLGQKTGAGVDQTLIN